MPSSWSSQVAPLAAFGSLVLLSVYRNSLAEGKRRKSKQNNNDLQRQRSPTETRSRFRGKQRKIKIACAPSAGEFHSCIDALVSAEDEVLVIRGTAGNTPSFDGGESRATTAAGGKQPTIFQGSVWDIASLQSCVGSRNITTICLDPSNIHGNDILSDSIALIRLLRSVFEHSLQTIVVKSRILSRHARSFHTHQSFMSAGGLAGLAKTNHCSQDEVQVVCAVGVSDYRSTIPLVVEEGDHVLEIGCHFGKSTGLLADAAKNEHTVGIDVGKVCIDRARQNEKYKTCRFEVADAWDTADLIQLDPAFNVIYLDVGGISGSDGIFEALTLVRQLICAFSSGRTSRRSALKCIVVKSRCLRDHAAIWHHSDDILRVAVDRSVKK